MPTGSGRCRFSRLCYRRRLLLELREDEPHELEDLDDEEDEPHEELLDAGFDAELLLEDPHEELVVAGLLAELDVLPHEELVVGAVVLAAVDEVEPHEELVVAGLLAVVVVAGAEKAETVWDFFEGSVTV